MPFNYPALLPLIGVCVCVYECVYCCFTLIISFLACADELLKHRMRPPPAWRQKFNDYLSTIPLYYATVCIINKVHLHIPSTL